MGDRPDERPDAGYDLLSDVLRTVRLCGAIFFDVQVADPWVAAAPATSLIGDTVIADAQHVIEYHVVIEGTCWARLADDGEPPVALSAGSIVAFPHGDPHVLASHPDLGGAPDLAAYETASRSETVPFVLNYQEGRDRTARILCGFLGCDVTPFNPLIAALPRMVHVPGAYGRTEDDLLPQLIRATVREANAKGPGSRGVLAKLSELIFIEMIRRYARTQDSTVAGWLSGARDPIVGRAVQFLHSDLTRAWTVADLAREVAVSRTVLSERFTAILGLGPMTYLANWRMQCAANLLRASPKPLSQIAVEVGYESEAAFSRAFKRATGISPAHWRRDT
ncbi:AraC family transcriptional regulator [Acuticoccus sediminis]|nr:AraC family transcriptional regulator [Acuticoccus sediminis]